MRAQQGQRQAVIVSGVEVNPLKNKQDTNTNTNTNKIELHESLLRPETTGVSWICAGGTLTTLHWDTGADSVGGELQVHTRNMNTNSNKCKYKYKYKYVC